MAVRNPQWYFSIGLPEGIDKTTRVEIAAAAIKHIIERSQSGKDARNRTFEKYTKAYAKKKGVSRTAVDLTLEDKMLKAMRLIKERKNELQIGYRKNSKDNAKCEGNILGTYGQQKPVQRRRNFLGMTQKEIVALVKRYAPEMTAQEIRDAQTNPTVAAT
jgi:hypothetical protein